MAHASESARPLKPIMTAIKHICELESLREDNGTVWLLLLPAGRRIADSERGIDWQKHLKRLAARTGKNSIVAILTSPEDAAETLPNLTDILKFQLWVAVKSRGDRAAASTRLMENHAALLILSRYTDSLCHTKTRIAYTFCPHCDKTTKDYGGKKHTYHEYGTLISDVWRDIQVDNRELPDRIITRLSDLFGLDSLSDLQIVDLRNCDSLKPSSIARSTLYDECRLEYFENSRLIRGESLAELRKMPNDCVDFCFADPPYNLEKKYDIWDDALTVNNYLNWCSDWIRELARVLRRGGTCAVLNIPSLAVKHFHQMKSAGLTFQNWIVWEGLSLPVRMIMPAHYSIVCFSKGVPRPLSGLRAAESSIENDALFALKEFYCVRQTCVQSRKTTRAVDREQITDLWWDIHRLKHNSRRVDHPCQLPPALMYRLIALFTHPGEVLLDPFNGAGTTSLCAEVMGRKYIGIELSEKYHSLALSRHQLLRNGDDPFGKRSSIPKAKNSRVKRIGTAKYEVSKKKLQLEVKRISTDLQRLPTREDLEKLSVYPIRMYDEYFINWGEVCAAARTTGMTENRKPVINHKIDEQKMLFE